MGGTSIQLEWLSISIMSKEVCYMRAVKRCVYGTLSDPEA